LNDFHAACIFFQQIAGISIPGDSSTFVDWYQTSETIKAVEPLRRWYGENKDQLDWDAKRQAVVLKPGRLRDRSVPQTLHLRQNIRSPQASAARESAPQRAPQIQ